jgi:hypothetical protein
MELFVREEGGSISSVVTNFIIKNNEIAFSIMPISHLKTAIETSPET